MTAERIPLRFAGAGRVAYLRELTGREEFAVSGASTGYAIDLLEALLEKPPALEAEPILATHLIAADRDLILAAVYAQAFGDRIENTVTCSRCAQPFDLDFSLRRLIESINERTAEGEWKAFGNGIFEGPDGIRLGLPTGRDELVVVGLPVEEGESILWERCSEVGNWPAGRSEFEDLLEEIAPLLDLELLARCVECNFVNKIEFDIQSYLLCAIAVERRRLLSEINRLASAYTWSLDEILSLTRSDRRQLVELLENQHLA